MSDWGSLTPDQRRRLSGSLMADQYAAEPQPLGLMGYDFNAAPLSPAIQNFAAQRGTPGVIQKTLGLIPGFDQDGKRGEQSWRNAMMSTAQFPIDVVAGMGQALTAPARAYRGEFDPLSEEGIGEGLNVAGNAMVGGLAAPRPRNSLGTVSRTETAGTGGTIMDRTLSRFGKPAQKDPFANPESGQPFTGSGWHGSPDNQLAAGSAVDRADPSAYLSPHGPWITNNRDVASTYGRVEPDAPFFSGSNVMPMEARFQNPMVYDAQGRLGGEAYVAPGNVAWDTNDLSAVAKQRGHDGLVVRNVRDELQGGGAPSDVYHPLERGTVYSPLTGDLLYANGGKSGAAAGAAVNSQNESLNDILRKYGLLDQNPMLSRPASPRYLPGDA